MTQSRQLAAIMFTDIVGYTALMGKDSAKALELVRISKEIQKPLVEMHHGQWLKEMGDGALVKFGTALDAVNCAIEIQELARAKFDGKLRIGIHLGDITIENDDVYGDGVNVASRLESIADPGGIYISESIEKAFQGQTDVQAKYLGEVKLKNVAYGVRTYAVQGVGLPIPEIKADKELSGHFWAEVQRRGVIQAGVTYVVLSLLLILLLPYASSLVNLPTWSSTALLGILIAGFPAALYLAWNYERSPEGFVRTTSEQSWQNPYTVNQRKPFTGRYIIMGLVLVMVIMYVYPRFLANPAGDSGVGDEVIISDKSIAIIPFKNLSSEEDSQYFSDGMLDAILSNLSKIGELRVISRTSTEQYRDSPKSISIIANELHVEHILEGSVQRDGDKVRIIVQLIDASLDEHIWSETYDKELKEVFEVQSDIAKQIAAALQAELSSGEKEIIENVPTENQVAYDFYLKGEDYLSRTLGNENDNASNAIKMYKQAVDSDPNFTLAWIGLAKASRGLYHWHISMEHLLKTKEYLDQAIALDPDLMEVQVETADYYYHCEINYQKSLDILEKLKYQYPKNEHIFVSIGHIYRRMGRLETALELQRHAISLSPFNWQGWSSTAHTFTILRRYSEAETYLNKVIELNPSLGFNYTRLALLFLITGELDKAKSLILDNQKVSDEIKNYTALLNRNFNQAIDIVNSSSEIAIGDQYKFVPKSLQLGLIYHCSSNKDAAEIHFNKSIKILTDTLDHFHDDARIYSSLGLAYAGLGRNEQAILYGQKALSIMNYSVDVIRAFYRELDMAKILLMTGNNIEAISKLEFLLEQNGYISVELLKRDPFWDPLREMEDFESLIRNPKYVIN